MTDAMIKVVPTVDQHLEEIQLRSCFDGEIKPKHVEGAVTFLLNGKPIAVFGGHLISLGLYQAWALISDGVMERPMAFHRCVRAILAYQIEKLELRRVQISVKVGYLAGWKWAKSLGFECEGIMKNYGPDGTDYWLFARVA